MSGTESDEALVERSRAGDRAAFEELVRRTARLVFSKAYLETGSVHRAEDLVQETFLIAWRSIRQVTDAKGFRPWLMSIARTAAVDAQRRESRKKRGGERARGDPAALSEVPDPGGDPADSAEQEDERERVLAVLRSLPEEYREPLMLRYLGDADYDTIGRQLGLSNGSLRGLLHRGMVLLRKELTRKEPGRSGVPKSAGEARSAADARSAGDAARRVPR